MQPTSPYPSSGPLSPFCVACPNHVDCAPDCCTTEKQVDLEYQAMVSLNSSAGSTATFDWTASPSDTTAQLYYGPTTSYGSTLSGTASGASGSLHLSGLAGYETFYYEVVVSSDITGETCYTDAGATGSFVPYYGHTLTMEFVVYNDSGTITVGDGPAIPSGSELTLYSPSSLTVSFDQSAASQVLGQSLQSWYTNAGTVSYPMEYTATLNVFSGDSSGTTSVAMSQPLTGWGGYAESGNDFTSATGTFVLPTTVTYNAGGQNGASSPTDVVGFWVGIGGVNGQADLWQAGVAITATSSSTSIYGFIEDADPEAESPLPPQYSYQATDTFYYNSSAPFCDRASDVSTLDLHLGDTVEVSVSYWNYGGASGYGTVGNFSITDQTNGGVWYGIQMCLDYAPDQTTADFIEEAPFQQNTTSEETFAAVMPYLGVNQATLFENMVTNLGPSPYLTPEAPFIAQGLCWYFPDGSSYYLAESLTPSLLGSTSSGSAEFEDGFSQTTQEEVPTACIEE